MISIPGGIALRGPTQVFQTYIQLTKTISRYNTPSSLLFKQCCDTGTYCVYYHGNCIRLSSVVFVHEPGVRVQQHCLHS